MKQHRPEDSLAVLCKNFNRLCNERQVSLPDISAQTGLRWEMLQELQDGNVPDELTISDLEALSNFFAVAVTEWFD